MNAQAVGASTGPESGPAAFFNAAELEVFAAHYPSRRCRLRHGVADDPLLSRNRLLSLAHLIPQENQEYNRGDINIDGHVEEAIPRNGLSIEETVRTIDCCNSWACLHNVEFHPDYKSLIDRFFTSISSVVEPSTGKIFRPESDIFVSSAGAVAPFHIDPQHNILMQISGFKRIWVFDANDDVVIPPAAHEAYHATGKANLVFDADRFKGRGECFELNPGDAVYIPVKAPHWVEVGPDEASVSISITWRSEMSDRERRVGLVNHTLRRFGFNPGRVRHGDPLDWAKGEVYRAYERVFLGRETRHP